MVAWTRLIAVEVVKSAQVLDVSGGQNQQCYRRKKGVKDSSRVFAIGRMQNFHNLLLVVQRSGIKFGLGHIKDKTPISCPRDVK